MNHFAFDETRGATSIPVFCPKPRRVGQLSGSDPFRPICWQASNHSELCDKSSLELLDIFLTKGGEVATSPPYFAGSPPTRLGNPVVNDPQFAEGKSDPVLIAGSGSGSETSYARSNFGFKPAQVRVEGFECRRGSQSISAMA